MYVSKLSSGRPPIIGCVGACMHCDKPQSWMISPDVSCITTNRQQRNRGALSYAVYISILLCCDAWYTKLRDGIYCMTSLTSLEGSRPGGKNFGPRSTHVQATRYRQRSCILSHVLVPFQSPMFNLILSDNLFRYA